MRTASSAFDVPAEIAIERPVGSARGVGVSVGCGTSGWFRGFSWMRDKKGALEGQVSGQIRWPIGCNDAEQHAAERAGRAPRAAPAERRSARSSREPSDGHVASRG